jgi:acyl dehydratase
MAAESDLHRLRDRATLLCKGHVLPDFTVGRVFEHERRKTVLESENALFTTLTLHYNPAYLDREHARALGFRDIVVNPLLVLNIAFGISVEDLSEGGGPFLGIEDVEFGPAVYAGDTLSARSTVVSSRPSGSHPLYGVVTWRTEGFNQRAECVVRFERSNLVKRSR